MRGISSGRGKSRAEWGNAASGYTGPKAPAVQSVETSGLRLPQTPNAVLIKHYVVAHDVQILRLRLSNEHSVKWISVRARKRSRSNTVSRGNRQFLELLSREESAKIGH